MKLNIKVETQTEEKKSQNSQKQESLSFNTREPKNRMPRRRGFIRRERRTVVE